MYVYVICYNLIIAKKVTAAWCSATFFSPPSNHISG